MKKIIAEAPDKVVIADVPSPRLGPDEVLIRAVRSLISPGSELNRIRRLPGDPENKWPNYDLGYAMAGVIEACGERVTGWHEGDRVVTMQPHQQYVVSPAYGDCIRSPIRIPDNVNWDDAPFICWSRSCYNWTMKAQIALGEIVAIVGLGLVGLLMTMWARLRGPRCVIALDLAPERLALASRVGADMLINPQQQDALQALDEATEGHRADCTLHCAAGSHVEAFELSQRITRPGGRVVLIGIHSAPLIILRHEFLHKDLLGAGAGYNYDPQLFEIGARFIANGTLPVSKIVTHNVPYTKAPEIYDMLNFRPQEAGAVLLRWDIE